MGTACSGNDLVTACRILAIQLGVLALLGLVARWVGSDVGLPVLVGGGIAIAANAWMTLVVFRPGASSNPRNLVMSLYVGEIGKYLFVMAFFALAFKKLAALREPHNALLVFLAFLLVQAVIWLWPWLGSKIETKE